MKILNIPQFFKNSFSRIRSLAYDAATTNNNNYKHWRPAGSGDAQACISPSLPTLRNRARYEIRNNSYARGILDTHANDLVGTGPTLQLDCGDAKIDREIENAFTRWCESCDIAGNQNFAQILRVAGSFAQNQDGESLIAFVTDPKAAKGEVSLRLQLIEADRLETPLSELSSELVHDGIKVDKFGKPTNYYILKYHPGSNSHAFNDSKCDILPAQSIIHLYRLDRPGQLRGVPRIASSLPLFAQLRRFTAATLDAAETAANMAGVLEQEADSDTEPAVAMDLVEIERNSLLTLPTGAKLSQLKAEHPTSTYKDFKRELLNEIARCLNMPYNIAAGNSSGYNYSSGRLDWQVYFKSLTVEQGWLANMACDRVFWQWYQEAALLNQVPQISQKTTSLAWYWPGAEHVDPVKEANAQKIRLDSLTTTFAHEYARQGKDWERELEQIAKEKKVIKKLSLNRDELIAEGI